MFNYLRRFDFFSNKNKRRIWTLHQIQIQIQSILLCFRKFKIQKTSWQTAITSTERREIKSMKKTTTANNNKRKSE